MKWFAILGSEAVFIVADAIAYKWSKGAHPWLLSVVVVLGAIGYGGFAMVCREVPLGSAVPLCGILVTSGAVLVGYLLYDEGLTWQQMLGLMFVVVAFILLNYHAPKE